MTEEPRTEAGRSFFGRLWAVSDYDSASKAIATAAHDIAKVEVEARDAALDAVVEKVQRLADFQDRGGTRWAFVGRKGVLDAIEEVRRG